MNNETFYVGLDLGSTQCYQVVMNERGKIVRSRPFATSEQNLRVCGVRVLFAATQRFSP